MTSSDVPSYTSRHTDHSSPNRGKGSEPGPEPELVPKTAPEPGSKPGPEPGQGPELEVGCATTSILRPCFYLALPFAHCLLHYSVPITSRVVREARATGGPLFPFRVWSSRLDRVIERVKTVIEKYRRSASVGASSDVHSGMNARIA